MTQAKARIISMGNYLPKKILTNQDLETLVDTTDEWIYSRTGMRERRIASDEENTSFMGTEAAKEAIEKSGIDPKDIDFVLVATTTPDFVCPNVAPIIQDAIGATQAGALDVGAACSGFLYGLSVAKAYIESSMYKNILFVASEKMSSLVDYTDRNTCILFGDGAAAAVISAEGAGLSISGVCLGSDGAQSSLACVPAGGVRLPTSKQTIDDGQHYFRMNGKEIFKHAVRRMEMSARECLEHTGIAASELSWIVPHQANKRIIDAMAKRFDAPGTRIYSQVQRYGNTSAASVPLALIDLQNEETLVAGNHLLLVVFGVGMSWGSALLTKT
jgi:3-oxoacyl-[acyl-carrier-protein] synthase-3